ncbi:MAG: AraC family transcriptional regulator [Lachnospiraceae bacterium]|nr:AraC family transcriptional regulator [Lachnospiraceae bacterium]
MILHQTKNSLSGSFYKNAPYSNENLIAYDFATHFHGCFEFVRAMEGTFTLQIGGLSEVMRPGDYALILPNEIHSFTFDGPFRLWIGMFTGDYVSSFQKHMVNKYATKIVFRPAADIDEILLTYLTHHKKSGLKYLTKGGLYLLCSEYLRLMPIEERTPKEGQLMSQLIDYIALHYAEPLSLKSISAALGYDYYYLSHCFSQFFNMHFTAYLNLYRAERAADDLVNTDLSVTEILGRNGFSSIRNFYAVFRNVYGTSPNEYRKAAAEAV